MIKIKKKVLHFIESAGIYGAENVILNICREMMSEGDYDPIIGSIVRSRNESNDFLERGSQYGIKGIKIIIRNEYAPIDIIAASIRLKKEKIDLIHSHGYKPSVISFIARFFTSIEIFSTCHLWYWGSNPPIKFRIMTALEMFFYRNFSCKIACVSNEKKLHD